MRRLWCLLGFHTGDWERPISRQVLIFNSFTDRKEVVLKDYQYRTCPHCKAVSQREVA